jgi:putative FmdB family regulatory protein
MPTYDYECGKCGHRFEIFQPMSSDPIKRCPKCGGRVKKLIGAGAGFIFKGSGFYETDYKRVTDKKKDSSGNVPESCKECKGGSCGIEKKRKGK